MIAKVLIKRNFLAGQEKEIISLLKNLLSEAMNMKGYISGETLMSWRNNNHLVTITTWQTMDDWINWKKSEERSHLDALLEVYQEDPTIYEEYLLGSPLHL
jgi:heme oxygenase (mycobilin-producing)